MVSYGFYVSTYLGSSITEDAFPALAARAQAKLNAYKRKYTVTAASDEAEAMAVCAMAEVLDYFDAAQNGAGAISSASIGSVSVSYGNTANAVDLSLRGQERQLYNAACVYLDIYRGVG
jgi:hypothetical protein